MGETVVYRSWKVELLETGGRWSFAAYRLGAKPGELERIRSQSPFASRAGALAAAQTVIDRRQ